MQSLPQTPELEIVVKDSRFRTNGIFREGQKFNLFDFNKHKSLDLRVNLKKSSRGLRLKTNLTTERDERGPGGFFKSGNPFAFETQNLITGVAFSLSGSFSSFFSVMYQAEKLHGGHTKWCFNGEFCGTRGDYNPIVSLTILIVPMSRRDAGKTVSEIQAKREAELEPHKKEIQRIQADLAHERKVREEIKKNLEVKRLFETIRQSIRPDLRAKIKNIANQNFDSVLQKSNVYIAQASTELALAYNRLENKVFDLENETLTAEEIKKKAKDQFDKHSAPIIKFMKDFDKMRQDNEITRLIHDLGQLAQQQEKGDDVEKMIKELSGKMFALSAERLLDLAKSFSVQVGPEAVGGVGGNWGVGFAFSPKIDIVEEVKKSKNIEDLQKTFANTEIDFKGLVGGNVVAGISLGVSAAINIGIWKSDIDKLDGMSWAVSVEIPVGGPVGIGISMVFGFDPVEYQGLVLSVGAGVGTSIATLSAGYTHSF